MGIWLTQLGSKGSGMFITIETIVWIVCMNYNLCRVDLVKIKSYNNHAVVNNSNIRLMD